MTKDKLIEKIKELLKTDIGLDLLMVLKRRKLRGWWLVLGIGEWLTFKIYRFDLN